MIYLWEPPECPNRFIAALDRKISPDRFLLLEGMRIAEGQVNNKFVFNLKVKQAEITQYDDIPNNAMMPLVNQKIRDILQEETPNEVQFFDAEIHCKDGVLTNYKLLNVTSTIKGIDYEKSIIKKMKLADAILGFRYLTYKPECFLKNPYAEYMLMRIDILIKYESPSTMHIIKPSTRFKSRPCCIKC